MVKKFILFLLITFSDIRLPFRQPVYEHADMIEMNHVYNGDKGSHSFTQIIFWERIPATGKYRVRDWVLVDDRESLCGIPQKNNGIYESHFKKSDYYYIVRSPLFRESWTMHDPEAADMSKHQRHLRNLLRKPNMKAPEDLSGIVE